MRADVRSLMTRIDAPTVANQTLAAASAIFTWGVNQEIIATNPCHGVERHAVTSRERVLSENEVAMFWKAFELSPNFGDGRSGQAAAVLG